MQTSRVKVAIRCRPPFEDELVDGKVPDIIQLYPKESKIQIHSKDPTIQSREFHYDLVFPIRIKQEKIFSFVLISFFFNIRLVKT